VSTVKSYYLHSDFDIKKEFNNFDGFESIKENDETIKLEKTQLKLHLGWLVKKIMIENYKKDFDIVLKGYLRFNNEPTNLYLIISFKNNTPELWREFKEIGENNATDNLVMWNYLNDLMHVYYYQIFENATIIKGIVEGENFCYYYELHGYSELSSVLTKEAVDVEIKYIIDSWKNN